MKCRLINSNIKSDYTKNLLKEKGVEDFEDFINPSESNLSTPYNLDYIEEGAKKLIKAINQGYPILIVVDCDCDGYTSAAILYNYIKKYCKDADVDFILHNGKQHGLEDLIVTIINREVTEERKEYKLVVLPDSSSNDYEYHEMLRQNDADCMCLVLDHHETEEDTKFAKNAIIINNQLSKNYKNKALTGAGVVYQFCRVLDDILGLNYAKDFIDLAAVGVIGDMGSMLSLENRYIAKAGLNNIQNSFISAIIDKQSFSMQGKINPTTIAFYVVPLINAMIRAGTFEEKQRMFRAFIDGEALVPSNKRGSKGELEKLAIESTRECANAKSKQDRVKISAVEKIEMKIHKNGLLENKILFVRLDDDDDFPSVLNGLVAMELSKRFKKPTIVARLNADGYCRGSARGLENCELNNLKAFLNESGFFEYNLGHPQAHGTSILNNNLANFHKYANEALKEVNFGENVYDVQFIRSAAEKDLGAIIMDIGKYESIWGQDISEPKIFVTDINLKRSDISIIGKNNNTVKFEKFGVTYIKFFAKDMIEELNQYNEIKLNIVGSMKINQWAGRSTPQIIIDNYDIFDNTLGF